MRQVEHDVQETQNMVASLKEGGCRKAQHPFPLAASSAWREHILDVANGVVVSITLSVISVPIGCCWELYHEEASKAVASEI